MPPVSPGAVQMMLPFMKKLALSPKGEQPVEIARGLMGLTESAAPQVSPFRKLLGMVPKEGGMVNPDMAIYPERGKFSFAFKPQGTQGDIMGSLGPGDNPKEAYLQYLGSSNSRRLGTGDVSQPMQDFRFDIRSPAQPEFQGRGFQPPPSKQARPARTYEERAPAAEAEGSGLPVPTLRQKQQAADKFLGLLRKAGFEGLSFSAEAGERPRLYEKLTGYKAEPIGETTIESLLGHMPGRQGYQGEAMSPGTYRSPLSRPMSPLEHVLQADRITTQMAENILGLSVDEALEYGLARRVGSDIRLTPMGQGAAREWLSQQGRL